MYEVKYRGIMFKGESKDSLLNNIKEYYKGKEIEDLSNVVKYATVAKKGKAQDFNPQQKRSVKFSDVVKGAAALLKISIGQVTDQLEINRRSGICTTCPNVKDVTDCRSCGFGGKLSKFIQKIKNETFKAQFTLPNNLSDKFCSVCSCSLAMMLPSKMNSFDEDKAKQKSRPSHCWVKKDSYNFVE